MDLKEIWKRLQSILIFGACYLATFFFIEARVVPINLIHTKFDDLIPFCEYFIIPYVLWYMYVAATTIYLGINIHKTKEYYRFIIHMALGMIVFVLVSLIYPNGQNLRPALVPDNIFGQAVKYLYTIDTSTNILPSLHVFASVACDIALCRDSFFQKHPLLQWSSHLMSFTITLSTMFLKQHSVIDVIADFICNAVFYASIYHFDRIKSVSYKRRLRLSATRE